MPTETGMFILGNSCNSVLGNLSITRGNPILKPRRKNQTISSNIVLDKVAKRSNNVCNAKCWVKLFDSLATSSKVLDCLNGLNPGVSVVCLV